MPTIKRVLLLIAFICFLAAAVGIEGRIATVPAGMAAWVLTALL